MIDFVDLSNIMNLKGVGNEDSKGLRNLYEAVSKYRLALKALNLPVEEMDIMTVFHLMLFLIP